MRADTQWSSRIWRYLMWAHTGLYGAMWLLSFIAAAQSTGGGFSELPGGYVLFLLVWSLVYIIHVASFTAVNARIQASGDDRQSYRDGYRDAMRNILAMQERDHADGRDDRRLMIDDDGELLEQLQGEKAKRREVR